MEQKQWTLYLIHHSHTDIGYTDLQENILFNQVTFLRQLIDIFKRGYENDTPEKRLKWNCETFCVVERFLRDATEQERADFFEFARRGNFGISGTYLNFTDLSDVTALERRTAEMRALLAENGLTLRAAMNADINGISMGARDVLIHNGVKLLMTNANTHHGLYPCGQVLTPFFWENDAGERLLVYSGAHYHVGNHLGLCVETNDPDEQTLAAAEEKIGIFLQSLEDSGFAYDFCPLAISGAWRDNGPPNEHLIYMVEAMNRRLKNVRLEMATLEEFWDKNAEKLQDCPVYRGDLTDWWANGIGSTPYATRHYRDAQRQYHINLLLDPAGAHTKADLTRETEDNLFLYAEHTWGYHCSVRQPHKSCVYDNELRKLSYASRAHEAAAMNFKYITRSLGDKLLYFGESGVMKAINPTQRAGRRVVHLVAETGPVEGLRVVDAASGREMTVQQFGHPRGIEICFLDDFAPGETKVYRYGPGAPVYKESYRRFRAGDAETPDVVGGPVPGGKLYRYGLENDWFRLSYAVGQGVTSLIDKRTGRELMPEGDARLFTPIYERTPIHGDVDRARFDLGHNIRGVDAELFPGKLTNVRLLSEGPVCTEVELAYDLPGTQGAWVILRMYKAAPRIDCTLRLSKTTSSDIESIFLPLTLRLPATPMYLDKGGVAFRPGVEQIPLTCMEFYIADHGVVYQEDDSAYLLATPDAPLVYQGPLRHHAVQLCDGREANNHRDIYSWVMNNMWETNFKLDLSGFSEFRYSLSLADTASPADSFAQLTADDLGIVSFGVEE